MHELSALPLPPWPPSLSAHASSPASPKSPCPAPPNAWRPTSPTLSKPRPSTGPPKPPPRAHRHQLHPSASRRWSPPRPGRGEISLPPRRFIITKSQFFESFSRWAWYLAWKVPLNISLLTSVIEKYHYQACRLGWEGSRVLERNRS